MASDFRSYTLTTYLPFCQSLLHPSIGFLQMPSHAPTSCVTWKLP